MNEQALTQIAAAVNAARFAEAEALCRALDNEVSLDPEFQFLFALSLHYQGKLDEALVLYADLTRKLPDSSVHWGNYGTALHEAGRHEEAQAAFEAALAHPPVETETLLNFGLLLLHRESYLEARDILLQAYAKNPDSSAIALAAARACDACKGLHADQILSRWREWLPLKDDQQLQLAKLLLSGGREADSARVLIEEVVRRSPDNLQASIQLADVYERVNQLADARTLLERLDADTSLDEFSRREVDHQRAMLALRQGAAATAKSILDHSGPRHDADFVHYFDMAKVCDKLGEYDAAMSALAVGHAKQLEKIKSIAPHLFEPGAPLLPQGKFRITAAEYHAWPQLISPETGQSPVFVVGFPRSGTTLLEQMLDAHPKLQSMDERPFFNMLAEQLRDYGVDIPQDLGKLAQKDCDELRKGYVTLACEKVPRRWDTRLVDKNPLNMLWLPMIHRMFPQAKWILALRHPCDVILSCYMQNFRANVLAAACANLERLAMAYVEAMQQWLYHVEVFKPNVFISRYEGLVADAPRQTEEIAKFLGLDDGTSMMRFDEKAREKGFIATPSYSQVVEPINTKGLNRWKRYPCEFDPLLPILKPMLEYWGYSIDMM